jgi:hypothetical protein
LRIWKWFEENAGMRECKNARMKKTDIGFKNTKEFVF